MVKQLSNAFRDSISLWIFHRWRLCSVQRRNRRHRRQNRCSIITRRKKGANHICVSRLLLSINLLMFDVAEVWARASAQRTVFVCVQKQKTFTRSFVYGAVCWKVDVIIRDSYFRSANGVFVTATTTTTEPLKLLWLRCRRSRQAWPNRPLFYISHSLNNYLIFQRRSGILFCSVRITEQNYYYCFDLVCWMVGCGFCGCWM